ncbi:hypothetical protein [Staphylococcus coagulans]|nr:hypothetical protein [Staphylococcus coagulans]
MSSRTGMIRIEKATSSVEGNQESILIDEQMEIRHMRKLIKVAN